MANKILLLEDDPNLNEIIQEFLCENGFEVCQSYNAQEAITLAYENNFDLLVLDVMVPLGNGFELLKQIRQSGVGTPAIFITALNRIDDLELGYKSGCDDYLKKPFELAELLLRINSILKRKFFHSSGDFVDLDNGFSFDINSSILYKDEKPFVLPHKEHLLLKMLLANKSKIITQDEIFGSLWEYNQEPSTMSLRVYIKNLRKILGKDKIINHRGQGYSYE